MQFLQLCSFFTLLFLSGTHVLQAQKRGYLTGYIITLEGDTLHGRVKDRSAEPFVEIYPRIRFRQEGKRRKRKYGPDQIRGYAAGERVYEALPLREETSFITFRYVLDPDADPVFLQVIRRDGPLNWYQREFLWDDNDFVDFYPLFHRRGSREMVRVTQGILGLKKKRLTEYFRDCPALVEALSKKELKQPRDVYEFYLSECRGR